jgi:hypothetical protein
MVVQSYQFSPFFTTVCSFLNKISEIMEPTMKIKGNAKTGFTNQLLIDIPRNQLMLINGVWLQLSVRLQNKV